MLEPHKLSNARITVIKYRLLNSLPSQSVEHANFPVVNMQTANILWAQPSPNQHEILTQPS